MRKWLIGLVLIAAVLAGLTLLSSRGGNEDYDTQLFAPGPTLGLLKALSDDALEGRGTGTVGNVKARELIAERMERLGLERPGEDYFIAFEAGGFSEARSFPAGVNIVGYLRGTGSSSRSIVITAHYDHLGIREGEIYNGADDNASGVAAILAMAEYFVANPPEHDMWFVAFDAEEQGFGGALSFMSKPPLLTDNIAFNLNLDMVSRGDNGKLWAVGTHDRPFLKPLVERVAAENSETVELLMGFDGSNEGQDDWTLQSDHRVFHERGIPFIYLGVEDHPDYHQPGDDFEKIDQDFYLAAVDTAIMLAREVDENLTAIDAAR